jgi:hypothetical protein
MPVSPSQQLAVTSMPVSSRSVALPQPTIAGTPISRATMAAWQVRPPLLVMMALAFFMIGSQSGSVMSVTSTSPCWKSLPSVLATAAVQAEQDAHLATADAVADGDALGDDLGWALPVG